MILRRFQVLLLSLCVCLLAGCESVAKVDELLRLRAYSNEKDRLALFVQKQNAGFERLLSAAKSNSLSKYPTRKSIWSNFGPPVFNTLVVLDGETYEVWVYRYSTKFFGSDKVYLYFDRQSSLRAYDYTPGGQLTKVQ